MIGKSTYILLIVIVYLTNASAAIWNNPHQGTNLQNTRYLPFLQPPKTLDPARSYSTDEHLIMAQIYEPLLQYHYLKRPYLLVPLTATTIPSVIYYDAQGKKLANTVNPKKIAFSVYDVFIKSGIYYQPHPALAKNENGKYFYFPVDGKILPHLHNLNDFKKTGTRELLADDYVYEIKRLVSPKTQSPLYGVMSKHILGFQELNNELQLAIKNQGNENFLDLRQYSLKGVKLIDHYHFQIIIKGVYPQFKNWLAMTFFTPIPWEADAFYSQSALINKNITLDRYPIGTGPYLLNENNPNKEIILVRNPNFHGETYPTEGEPDDVKQGYLQDAGKALPFIDRVVFVLDKESIPRWNKFLQGYYDKSGISPEGFDYAIKIDPSGNPYVTPIIEKLGVKLQTIVAPGIYYIGFNMLDPIVGGYSEKQQKLRQAIAIALDEEEFIAIFMNGRGIPAQGPIPPGIFGYLEGEKGINPYMYHWVNGKAQRFSLNEAKNLLAEAGYPGGINSRTGKALLLNYDVTTTGNPDDKAQFDWLRKQFAKLGIQLNIRATLYSRFRDRVQTGQVQIFSWGWMADYPDPENFLFLLYTPNGTVKYGGENSTNYSNIQADQLFEEIRLLPNGLARQKKINEFLNIVRKDSPWVWGFYPIEFGLSHQWNRASKPHGVAGNLLKYERLDIVTRNQLRQQWNQPIVWPLVIFILIIILIFIPLAISYWRREHRPTIKKISL